MLLKFIHPTKKNVLIGFVLCQLFPILVLGLNQKIDRLDAWVQFELVILGALCLWEVKPVSQLDERELTVLLKWKGRMLEIISSMALIPIIVLSLKPETTGWNLFIISSIPVYTAFVVCTLLLKRELGYFFFHEDIVSE